MTKDIEKICSECEGGKMTLEKYIISSFEDILEKTESLAFYTFEAIYKKDHRDFVNKQIHNLEKERNISITLFLNKLKEIGINLNQERY